VAPLATKRLSSWIKLAILSQPGYAQIMSTPDSAQPKFAHKKSLGQNFLTSDIVPRWLCEAGDVKTGDLVYEIGPGTGRLTSELLARNATVIAVEADERALLLLNQTFSAAIASGQLTLHHGDVRTISPTTFKLPDQKFKVIANIPYYLSGFLLRQILESTTQPTTLVFLMQKELVERIARAKKASILSLSVKAFGQPRYVKTVTRGHFNPSPKVDSAILQITNISRENFKDFPVSHFFTLLHLGLGKKRKQLIANLSQEYERGLIGAILLALDRPVNVRGEDLNCLDWLELAKALPEQNIHLL
jgi:16S rRNA (adenine1518-N6/adenine1519-N6)-dimethyltransferase